MHNISNHKLNKVNAKKQVVTKKDKSSKCRTKTGQLADIIFQYDLLLLCSQTHYTATQWFKQTEPHSFL